MKSIKRLFGMFGSSERVPYKCDGCDIAMSVLERGKLERVPCVLCGTVFIKAPHVPGKVSA